MKTLSEIKYEAEQSIIIFSDCSNDFKKCERIHLFVDSIFGRYQQVLLSDLDKAINTFKTFLK